MSMSRGRDEAKFWLQRDVQISYNDGLDPRTLRSARLIVERERAVFLRKWHEHFA